MQWLIVFGVVMFVIAPVMWLKPSPRQKRQVGLKACARKQGVIVQMEKPPLHHFKGMMPAYRWNYAQDAPGPDFVLLRESEASDALASFHAGWRWRIAPLRPLPDDAETALKALLERLPRDALVIESSARALTLWWWESQGAERFEHYAQSFAALRQMLGGHADHLAPPQR
ncbi:preprotein translocase subunit YajC [Vreelandella malpeensis]|uniref:Preprotein translocase subunit YajC n=1 Tax=Vreelandella malpeensis TaxID=1172368 RepID=A0ABS8DV70_9GAMM|nr:preprotein translocase subunit YajC [Halomonas malpeensis]MCB8890136.1 preprotein translocase subunit YajC [Halomonas malpeensis]